MRGRIRQLKPELFLDDDFWTVLQAYPTLPILQGFLGLWCQADREGRFEWRPAVLKTQILPYWEGDFARVLKALELSGLVQSYEVDGRRYGVIRSFLRHQRPNNREPRSCIPEPLESAQATSVSVQEPRGEAAEAPRAPRLPTPDSQHPTPTPMREPPEVPGLTVVANDPPSKRLPPSKRERDLAAQADALAKAAPTGLRHKYTPGFLPTKAVNLARAIELGLSEEELWQRWYECADRRYPSPFDDDEGQFNRELAWAKADKEKNSFKSKRDRDAFELPGRERRAQ